ncbi:cytochrome d ubiquinol oxidase subunit II [Nakamurella silvestris]|nr:cytochrome d ubiquinol oxidase subunit II [Nakamurella silvestris]
MDLNTLWFWLIAVLWTGYFVLEGFDFGVGALLRLVGRDERGKRVLINTIGPVWDGNEVWVITAGGAMFAAFPEWYATLFSGFYLPLLAILVCLIIRGVAFEYRAKGTTDRWRANWDRAILVTSILPAFLWGVAFGNIISGVPLDVDHEFAGTVLDLLNPFALLMGLTTLLLFVTHGAVFLSLKTTLEVRDRARKLAVTLGSATVVSLAAVLIWRQFRGGNTGTAGLAVLSVVGAVAAVMLTRAGRDGWAFTATAVAVLTLVAGWFVGLFPNVLPSTTEVLGTLDIHNAASSPYTLTLMSWVALFFVPFVLGYQAWTYWVFRKRIGTKQIPMPVHTDH